MVRGPYIPEAGDIAWISFDPQAGHEQAGRRPGLVISPAKYNGPTGFALVCPITSKVKGYPFEVPIAGKRIEGVVLTDQLRSLDANARQFAFIERAGEEVMQAVRRLQGKLLQII